MYEGKELKSKLESGKTCIGTWVFSSDPTTVELLAGSGFDFIILDSEHSALDIETVQTGIMAANASKVPVLVRVAWNDQVLIKRVLDAGAGGVVVPLIRNAEDARDAVAACMYPPCGIRGFGPRRPSNYGRLGSEYIKCANDNVVVFAQIEHIDAVGNIDEILAVPGLTGVLIGRNDLSGSMGVLGQPEHAMVVEAVDKVLAAVKEANARVGIVLSSDPNQALKWVEKGVDFITLDCDDGFLIQASQASVNGTRELFKSKGIS